MLDRATHHSCIKEEDIKTMHTSGTLSEINPTCLQLKVFFEVVLHFGRQGREGLRELRKDHIHFMLDDIRVEYATRSHNPLEKNHQGFFYHDTEHDQRIYSTGAMITTGGNHGASP